MTFVIGGGNPCLVIRGDHNLSHNERCLKTKKKRRENFIDIAGPKKVRDHKIPGLESVSSPRPVRVIVR